jgi:3-deoxy-D-manno-octulosonic acid kinase
MMPNYIIYSNLQTFEVDFFDPKYWQDKNQINKIGIGRADAYLIDLDNQQWVLKEYRRGGRIGRILSNQYFYLSAKNIRPIKEWKIINQLFLSGLPIPKPIGLLVSTAPFIYSASLITEYLKDTVTLLDKIMIGGNLNEYYWKSIGITIKKFHDYGVSHSDLNLRNLLINNKNEIFMIDFDKAFITTKKTYFHSNLKRFKRSIFKHIRLEREAEMAYQLVLEGYNVNSIA